MALPSGYTRLEYIQSTGTQYINSQYKATSENYRIKCRFKFETIVNNTVPFGGGASTDIISALIRNSTILRFYVGSGSVSATDVTITPGVEYEMECHANNGTFTVNLNGVTYSGSYSGEINKDYPLFLFANNVSGTASQLSSICYLEYQIYDNGVIVRDYIPSKNTSGAIGLWDDANSEFYPNAGSGSFIAGPKVETNPMTPHDGHNTNIGNVARQIESGTARIGGVLREIESGLVLVNGVQREIAFGPDDCTITLYGKPDASNVRYLSRVEIDGTEYYGYSVAPSTQVVVAKGTQIELEVLSNNGNKIPYIKVNGTTVRTGDATMMFTVTKDTNITLSYATQNDGDDRGGTIEITEL